MKKNLLIMFVLYSFSINAQQLSYDTNSEIYHIIGSAESRGILTYLSSTRPYTEAQIQDYLTLILNHKKTTSQEKHVIQSYLNDFTENNTLTSGTFAHQEEWAEISLSGYASTEFRSNFIIPEDFHTHSLFGIDIKGNLMDSFYFRLKPDMTFDLAELDTYTPYSFTKQWDGFHRAPELYYDAVRDTPSPNGKEEPIGMCWNGSQEITGSLFNNTLRLSWGRFRRSWGVGDNNLIISPTARPFDAIQMSIMPFDWFNFHFLTGGLEYEFVDGTQNYQTMNESQKMLSIVSLEVSPFSWLYLDIFGTIIWGKRLDPIYLNPLHFSVLYQNIIGDMDNIAMGLNGHVIIPYVGKFYASCYFDEADNFDPEEFFTYPKNQFAWLVGLKTPIPGLPFTTTTLQYTKLEPYVYTHYPQAYPFYDDSVKININYTNNGENLGYPLPPNSDEIKFKVTSFPIPRLNVSLQYQLIRHGTAELPFKMGTQEWDDYNGPIPITGEYDHWLDYKKRANGQYPDKDFLNEPGTIYEWINAVSLRGEYNFVDLGVPLTVWAEYAFSHTDWYEQGVKLADPARFQHILVVGMRLW